jgi:alpha/beta hydrolase fold.
MFSDSVTLRLVRSHFLGGRQASVDGLPVVRERVVGNGPARDLDMNGSYCVGQIYVQEFRLAHPRHALPVLLWHGGGMTGAQWEATPDGRPGWAWRFLQAGYDVFVADAPERGRASWAMFPQIYRQPPVFRSMQEAWRLFRIGADYADRHPFPGQQFPVEAFDVFARQFVPRWIGHDALAMEGYREMLRLAGPAIVIGHSQGGGFAARLAAEQPSAFAAVVGIEPTGLPEDVPAGGPAHLAVWGDHIALSDVWHAYRACARSYWSALKARGLRADELDLPSAGLPGNSHFCMLDRNSDAVFERVLQWLSSAAVPLLDLL